MARDTTGATQNKATVTLLSIKIGLPECASLKEKRSQLKPLLSRIHKVYNASVAETGLQDFWQSAWLTCALVSNDARFSVKIANEILREIETRFPHLVIDEYHIENR